MSFALNNYWCSPEVVPDRCWLAVLRRSPMMLDYYPRESLVGRGSEMARRRYRRWRRSWGPLLGAFACGILAYLGLDPKGMVVQSLVGAVAPYLQFASWVLVLVVVYLAISPFIAHLGRTREAYRRAGWLGVLGIVLALIAGVELLQWWEISLPLLAVGAAFWVIGRHV